MAILRGFRTVPFGLTALLLVLLSGCQQSVESAGPQAMQAILKKDYATAEKLAKAVPGLGNYEDPKFSVTVLQRAAYAGQPNLVDLLIAGGANVNRRSHGGGTPMLCALKGRKDPETIRRLIAAKVDLNAVDEHGDTALHSAVGVVNVEAVRAIIEGGADRFLLDGDGNTALQRAKYKRDVLTQADVPADDGSVTSAVRAAKREAVKILAGNDGLAKLDQIIAILEAK